MRGITGVPPLGGLGVIAGGGAGLPPLGLWCLNMGCVVGSALVPPFEDGANAIDSNLKPSTTDSAVEPDASLNRT